MQRCGALLARRNVRQYTGRPIARDDPSVRRGGGRRPRESRRSMTSEPDGKTIACLEPRWESPGRTSL